jgi:hypothetical protein
VGVEAAAMGAADGGSGVTMLPTIPIFDRGTALLTSTCREREREREREKRVSEGSRERGVERVYSFPIDRVLPFVADLVDTALIVENDEAKATRLVSLSIEHHLSRDHLPILLEIMSELACDQRGETERSEGEDTREETDRHECHNATHQQRFYNMDTHHC